MFLLQARFRDARLEQRRGAAAEPVALGRAAALEREHDADQVRRRELGGSGGGGCDAAPFGANGSTGTARIAAAATAARVDIEASAEASAHNSRRRDARMCAASTSARSGYAAPGVTGGGGGRRRFVRVPRRR